MGLPTRYKWLLEACKTLLFKMCRTRHVAANEAGTFSRPQSNTWGAPNPSNEAGRLEAMHFLRMMKDAPDPRLDELTFILQQLFEVMVLPAHGKTCSTLHMLFHGIRF